jgi:hypothetical protein
MTLLNFTVDFGLSKLLDGTKTRTMRPVRENPNSVWNRLYAKFKKHPYNPQISNYWQYLQIYWRQRSRYCVCDVCGLKRIYSGDADNDHCSNWECDGTLHKEAHHLFDAVLTNMTPRPLGSLTEDEWRLDGFSSSSIYQETISARDAGLKWFAETYSLSYSEVINFPIYIIEFRRVT